MIDYTIIVPTHNSASYLPRLLSSIPRSPQVEVIVVDDHSDPENALETRHLVEQSGLSNASYVLNPGKKGAGAARNVGIERARGKWVVFADSDDYFTPYFQEAMIQYRNSSAGTVIFRMDTAPNTNGISRTTHLEALFQQNDVNNIGYSTASLVSRFIKLSVIQDHGLRCSETIVENDRYLSVTSYFFAGERIADSNVIYLTTIRSGSLANHRQSLEELIARAQVRADVSDFLIAHLDGKEKYRIVPAQGNLWMTALLAVGPKGVMKVAATCYGHHMPITHRKLREIPGAFRRWISQSRTGFSMTQDYLGSIDPGDPDDTVVPNGTG